MAAAPIKLRTTFNL